MAFSFFFQAEDGIRDLVRSRGLGDVYKRQAYSWTERKNVKIDIYNGEIGFVIPHPFDKSKAGSCLLYTSDAADERSSVDLGGRRIIKKKTRPVQCSCRPYQ